jgi:hypothetical protein
MSGTGTEKLICCKCNVELVLADVALEYLGHKLTQPFPTCPVCKAVYIPEEAVSGKIRKLEMVLEEK